MTKKPGGGLKKESFKTAARKLLGDNGGYGLLSSDRGRLRALDVMELAKPRDLSDLVGFFVRLETGSSKASHCHNSFFRMDKGTFGAQVMRLILNLATPDDAAAVLAMARPIGEGKGSVAGQSHQNLQLIDFLKVLLFMPSE